MIERQETRVAARARLPGRDRARVREARCQAERQEAEVGVRARCQDEIQEAELGARARCQGEAPDQITHCPETQGYKGSPRDTEERCVIRSDVCNFALESLFYIHYV